MGLSGGMSPAQLWLRDDGPDPSELQAESSRQGHSGPEGAARTAGPTVSGGRLVAEGSGSPRVFTDWNHRVSKAKTARILT